MLHQKTDASNPPQKDTYQHLVDLFQEKQQIQQDLSHLSQKIQEIEDKLKKN